MVKTMADKAAIAKGQKHFMETLGNIPEPIRAMIDYAPDMFVGYLTMREAIYREPPAGALDLKTKELIYVILDVVTGNLDGAKNHYRAAHKAGCTVAELAEACMQVMAVCGITTWGQTGWKLCDFAAELEKAPAKKKPGRAVKKAKKSRR